MAEQSEKAKAERHKRTWDPRGVYLSSMRLTWTAVAPADAWANLVAKTAMDPAEGMNPEASFVAMASPNVRGAVVVSVGFHQAENETPKADGIATHWHLRLYRAPSNKPPASVSSSNDKVGGYPRALERLAEQWPAKREHKVEVSLTYDVDGGRYDIRHQMLTNITDVSVGDYDLSPGALVWRVKRGKIMLGVLSCSIKHGPRDVIHVTWSGTASTAISADIINQVDEATWGVVVKLLRQRTKRRSEA